MVAINRDIFLRTLCLIAAFAYRTAQGARMGDVYLAANAVLFNLVTFMAYVLEGFARASQAVVGRACARDQRPTIAARCGSRPCRCRGIAAAFTVVYAMTGGLMVDLLTSMPEVRAVAYAALPWMIATPLVSIWAISSTASSSVPRGRLIMNRCFDASISNDCLFYS